jgi:hypothetical protein
MNDESGKSYLGEFPERRAAIMEELAHSPVTQDTIQFVVEGVVEALQRGGNHALADQYTGAFDAALRTTKAHAQWISVQAERDLTDGEQVRAAAAEGASDEANEHATRVMGEVTAFLGRPRTR